MLPYLALVVGGGEVDRLDSAIFHSGKHPEHFFILLKIWTQ
jgi:hypothetical protein